MGKEIKCELCGVMIDYEKETYWIVTFKSGPKPLCVECHKEYSEFMAGTFRKAGAVKA